MAAPAAPGLLCKHRAGGFQAPEWARSRSGRRAGRLQAGLGCLRGADGAGGKARQPPTLLCSPRQTLLIESSTEIDSRKLFVSKMKNVFVLLYSAERGSAMKCQGVTGQPWPPQGQGPTGLCFMPGQGRDQPAPLLGDNTATGSALAEKWV